MMLVRSNLSNESADEGGVALHQVTHGFLRTLVELISVPRNNWAEPRNNRRMAERVAGRFEEFGFRVEWQGDYHNIVAMPTGVKPQVLVGAHYDSVPDCPGADDNASAVAVMIGCAKTIAKLRPNAPVCFVSFNCEEDGLLGSTDFVENYMRPNGLDLEAAHILEMVGYRTAEPGSQRVPPGIPIKAPESGDFIGLLANRDSNPLLDSVVRYAPHDAPGLSVLGLKVYLGMERWLPVLERSDHAPFWNSRIPALMWTDTSEFRNPHYHRASDTPDTLDYNFMRQVTQLLTGSVLRTVQEHG